MPRSAKHRVLPLAQKVTNTLSRRLPPLAAIAKAADCEALEQSGSGAVVILFGSGPWAA